MRSHLLCILSTVDSREVSQLDKRDGTCHATSVCFPPDKLEHDILVSSTPARHPRNLISVLGTPEINNDLSIRFKKTACAFRHSNTGSVPLQR